MSALSDLELELLKYPIGKFIRGTKADGSERRAECIAAIELFPNKLWAAVKEMGQEQLETPYRPGGWSARQLVHHIADSHGQSLHRFKLALTEDRPTIKPYKEALWAEHADARTMALEPSFGIIAGTHARWVVLMRSMAPPEYDRAFYHPEQQREISLAEALELYVWHSAHHLRHITALKERMGWK